MLSFHFISDPPEVLFRYGLLCGSVLVRSMCRHPSCHPKRPGKKKKNMVTLEFWLRQAVGTFCHPQINSFFGRPSVLCYSYKVEGTKRCSMSYLYLTGVKHRQSSQDRHPLHFVGREVSSSAATHATPSKVSSFVFYLLRLRLYKIAFRIEQHVPNLTGASILLIQGAFQGQGSARG